MGKSEKEFSLKVYWPTREYQWLTDRCRWKSRCKCQSPKKGALYRGQTSKTRKKLYCNSGGDANEPHCPCTVGNRSCTSLCKCFNCGKRPPTIPVTNLETWNLVIFPFPNVDLGITVVSLVQNTRGSTLGKERGKFKWERRCQEWV